jgi:hypothetical protein
MAESCDIWSMSYELTSLARLASRDGIVIRYAADKEDGEFIVTLARPDRANPGGEIVARPLGFKQPERISGKPRVESVLLYFLMLASYRDSVFDIVPGAKDLMLSPVAPHLRPWPNAWPRDRSRSRPKVAPSPSCLTPTRYPARSGRHWTRATCRASRCPPGRHKG